MDVVANPDGRQHRSFEAFKNQFSTIPETQRQWRERAQLARLANQQLDEYHAVREAQDKLRRAPGYQAIPRNPYMGYNVDANMDLADVVGKHNLGIKFNPVFNSKPAADDWLEDQRDRAVRRGDEKTWERLKDWKIEYEDMDRDPTTIPNVVVYSDFPNKRIKAVDGFMTVPRGKKEALRAQYDIYPTRELRRDNMSKPEERKKLKAYFRKHPNPKTWDAFPYDKFELPETMFNKIKRVLIAPDLQKAGFTINSSKNPDGSLTVAHYMTIIQKIMSFYMNIAWLLITPGISVNDLYPIDKFKIKTKRRQRILIQRLKGDITAEDWRILRGIFTGLGLPEQPPFQRMELFSVLQAVIIGLFLIDDGTSETLDDGTKVVGSSIFRIIDDINTRSGETELKIVSKITADGDIDKTHYEIEDYKIKGKGLQKERRPHIRQPGVKLEENEEPIVRRRYTTISQQPKLSLQPTTFIKSPAKVFRLPTKLSEVPLFEDPQSISTPVHPIRSLDTTTIGTRGRGRGGRGEFLDTTIRGGRGGRGGRGRGRGRSTSVGPSLFPGSGINVEDPVDLLTPDDIRNIPSIPSVPPSDEF